MNGVNVDDFETDDKIDWAAYHKAQVAAGEICSKCGTHLMYFFANSPKGPTECRACKGIAETSELDHEIYVRCPKCKCTWNPRETEDYHLMEDGEHSVACEDCGHDFEVSTIVSYSFCSPGLISDECED